VVDKPPLPVWAKPAMVAGVILAVLLIILGVASLVNLRPITPVIETFSVGQGQLEITRGTPVQLQWTTKDTERLTLQVGDAPPQDVTEVSGGVYQVPTDTLTGQVTFRLVAYNGNQQANSEQTLRVYRAAVIDDLRVMPAVVYRNVVQELTVTWTGQGFTDGIRLRGLESVGQPAEIISVDEIGVYTFSTLPQTNFTVRLLVSDERGIEFERTFDVILLDPQCTVNRSEIPLLTTPSEQGVIREVLTQGVSRIITGRSADGGYLLVRLTDGSEAWARVGDFTCPSEQFDINDLRVIVVQLPTPSAPTATTEPPLIIVLPTATPTNTPSPSPTITPSSTSTSSATPTATLTLTLTATITSSRTATQTRTHTPTPILMATRTPSQTPQG
jgi:hypothetical protein